MSDMSTSTHSRKQHIKPRKHDWPAIIKDWQSSKLTVKAYCNEHKIARSPFYLWKKRLTESQGRFVPIQIESLARPSLLTIRFDPKPEVCIPCDILPEQLKMIMQLLVDVSC